MNNRKVLLSCLIFIISLYGLSGADFTNSNIKELEYVNYANSTNIVSSNYEKGVNDSVKVGIGTKEKIPPLNLIRIAGECAGGIIIESVSLDVLNYIFGNKNIIWDLGVGGFGIIPNFIIISVDQLVVFFIGNIGDETGSLAKTMLYGTAISIGLQAIGVGLYSAYNYINPVDSLCYNENFYFNVIMYVVPIIGAVMGFNFTRKYKEIQVKAKGLVNLENKKASVNFPDIYTREISGYKSIGIDLININL